MKSVRISDETYTKIVRNAKKNRRTISGTIELLIEYGMQVVDTANMNMNMNMSMGMGMDMGIGGAITGLEPPKTEYLTLEEANEQERQRIERKLAAGWKPKVEPDLTEEELIAMNKQLKEGKAN